MTDSSLDNILSGSGDAPETNEREGQVAPVAEGESQQEQPETEGNEGGEQGQRMVPQQALHAEKQKVKRYTDEVVDLRRSNETLQRQVAEVLQRIPVQKQEQPQAPDQFEDFQGATRHVVQPEFERINQTLLAIARDNAETRFTPELVNAAEQSFMEALQNKTLDPADYQKVVSSPNRYAAAVQWHKQQAARAEIGDDPAAYRVKLEAEILAKHGLTADGAAAQSQQQKPVPVMPSNLSGVRNVGSRSGPAWSGPPSLNEIFDTSRPG